MTDASTLTLLPAVDVAGGQAVRLQHAELGSAVEYGDPLATALEWQRAGASWVHVVDIDAAFGRGSNHDQLAAIVARVDLDVQLSGGICDEASLATALATGCARVNLGTAALADLSWVIDTVQLHGDRVAVGLDVRGERLVARGANVDVGALSEVLATLDDVGCARYIVTDVARDGALTGPNLELLRRVCGQTNRPVIASGGVARLADVADLRELVPAGVEAAIIGQALYAGRFTLATALAVAAGADVADPGISPPATW